MEAKDIIINELIEAIKSNKMELVSRSTLNGKLNSFNKDEKLSILNEVINIMNKEPKKYTNFRYFKGYRDSIVMYGN